MSTKLLRWALIGLDVLAASSALAGGFMVATGWPYQFPAAWLQGTPFADYTVPGLILGLVVGGSALIATFAMVRSRQTGAVASLIAGVIMAGWIVGEVLILGQYTWLQPFYFAVGAAMAFVAIKVAPQGWRGLAHTAHLG